MRFSGYEPERIPVTMAKGSHLFPYRTQKLSLSAPMVLGWRRPGRVGRCRIPKEKAQPYGWAFSFTTGNCLLPGHLQPSPGQCTWKQDVQIKCERVPCLGKRTEQRGGLYPCAQENLKQGALNVFEALNRRIDKLIDTKKPEKPR